MGPALYPLFFFLNDRPPTEIYPLPLHDALPISLPNTVELVASGFILGVLMGIAGGLLMFAFRDRSAEQAIALASTAMMSIPEFLWALLLILLLRSEEHNV